MVALNKVGSIHWSVMLTSILFLGLVVTAVYRFFNAPENKMGSIVAADLSVMANIFKEIETNCSIVGVKGNKDSIDFLNVASFAGKDVGPLTLAYPEKWQGPYLKDNPKIQGKFYQLVKTLKGYFILPGDGVELPNGKIMGKDLIITESSDLPALLKDATALFYNGKSLGIQLDISTSVFDDLMTENIIASNDGFAMKAQDSSVPVAKT
jgi:hypothetical protein